MSLAEVQEVVDRWLVKFETVRPPETLGMLTPA